MEIRARCNHVGWHQRNRSALPLPTAHLVSIRRIDHDVLRSLGLIPGASALLIDHATIVHRYAAWRHASHHRADDGGSHGDGSANRRCSRDRMVVIVPAATATAMTFDIDVDVAVNVDVIDTSASDIVGTGISLAVLTCALFLVPPPPAPVARAPPPLAPAARPPPPPPPRREHHHHLHHLHRRHPEPRGINVRGYGEAGENGAANEAGSNLPNDLFMLALLYFVFTGTISTLDAPLGGVNLKTVSLKVGFKFQSIRETDCGRASSVRLVITTLRGSSACSRR